MQLLRQHGGHENDPSREEEHYEGGFQVEAGESGGPHHVGGFHVDPFRVWPQKMRQHAETLTTHGYQVEVREYFDGEILEVTPPAPQPRVAWLRDSSGDEQGPDHPRHRRLVEGFAAMATTHWSGDLDEPDFLARLYPLEKMPSTSRRYDTAGRDIFQRRVLNPLPAAEARRVSRGATHEPRWRPHAHDQTSASGADEACESAPPRAKSLGVRRLRRRLQTCRRGAPTNRCDGHERPLNWENAVLILPRMVHPKRVPKRGPKRVLGRRSCEPRSGRCEPRAGLRP